MKHTKLFDIAAGTVLGQEYRAFPIRQPQMPEE